jgi:hypothetical protein
MFSNHVKYILKIVCFAVIFSHVSSNILNILFCSNLSLYVDLLSPV